MLEGALSDEDASAEARRRARVGVQLMADTARELRKMAGLVGGFLGGKRK